MLLLTSDTNITENINIIIFKYMYPSNAEGNAITSALIGTTIKEGISYVEAIQFEIIS